MNAIKLSGRIIDLKYSHVCAGEEFYSFQMENLRLSGVVDVIPCIIPKSLADGLTGCEKAEILGEVRSRNVIRENGKRGCDVFVFVKNVSEYSGVDVNAVSLYGIVCKEPWLRSTPKGREVAETILASNRDFVNRTDYIPILAWQRAAQRLSRLPVGAHIAVEARLQSRTYGNGKGRTIEMSCYSLKEVESMGKEGTYEGNSNNDV